MTTTTKERGLIVSDWEANVIREGKKTQRRCVVKPQPERCEHGGYCFEPNSKTSIILPPGQTHSDAMPKFCPLGQPGDRLWLRENFWAKHDVEYGDYGALLCDAGPGLDLGKEFHPGIQYAATPTSSQWPPLSNQQTVLRHKGPPGPGEWMLTPSENWNGLEGDLDLEQRGVWVFCPWDKHVTKCSSVQMPRWAARTIVELVSVRVERLQDITKADVEAEGITRRMGAPLEDVVAGWHEPFAELWDDPNAKKGNPWDSNPFVWVPEFKVIEGAA